MSVVGHWSPPTNRSLVLMPNGRLSLVTEDQRLTRTNAITSQLVWSNLMVNLLDDIYIYIYIYLPYSRFNQGFFYIHIFILSTVGRINSSPPPSCPTTAGCATSSSTRAARPRFTPRERSTASGSTSSDCALSQVS